MRVASVPLLSGQAFLDDRKALWGSAFNPQVLSQSRPGLMVEVDLNIELIEKLLSDGRKWLQNLNEPTVADIHVAFFFQWATELSATFLEDREINTKHPRAYDFLQRYNALATGFQLHRTLIQGSEAISRIRSAGFAEDSKIVEEDPSQLVSEQKVAV